MNFDETGVLVAHPPDETIAGDVERECETAPHTQSETIQSRRLQTVHRITLKSMTQAVPALEVGESPNLLRDWISLGTKF